MASITIGRTARTGRPLGIADLLARITRRAFVRSEPVEQIRVEAAAVRRLADRQRSWSPSFAADLYAAADRHEMGNRR